MVSTFPPKICGLATFASALTAAMEKAGTTVETIALRHAHERFPTSASNQIGGELVSEDPLSLRRAAALLSRCDTVIIQHEYGIFGGTDGAEVLQLLRALTVPTVVVLHTVPLQPTPNQRDILIAIAENADAVVVMTLVAKDRLFRLYPVDSAKVHTIPHGAATPQPRRFNATKLDTPAPQLLTWGLLGPGKGLEHAIDALSLLQDLPTPPHYTIAGVTHPNVLARDGDVYRDGLIARAADLGLDRSVHFDAKYRNVAELTQFVASASVVVLPYDSRDQVTSGVLVDAIAAGRPVIATAFPHAVELLSTGAGLVVPHADPRALADAIRLVLTNESRLTAMTNEARRIAPSLRWSSVATEYLRLSEGLPARRESVTL